MKTFFGHKFLAVLLLLASVASVHAASLDAELLDIQQTWARINYSAASADQKATEFGQLATRAAALAASQPGRAEPMVWHGIALSSQAGAKGGLGALSLAKQARSVLESSLKIDATALSGSAHTSLGTLYHKVPGFPVGFGNDKKARQHLEAALKLNPSGIDPNFFYAEFLLDEGETALAIKHLKIAQAAPSRPGRETADAGRRQEIAALLGKAGSAGR
jgi:tetratricopeptide (TPR) repeat protein